MRVTEKSNIKYGDFIVMKMQEVDNNGLYYIVSYSKNNPITYGVFRIDVRKTGFVDDTLTPADSHKIRLTPVGRENYLERDWYTCDIFGYGTDFIVYDDFEEANALANNLNAFEKSVNAKKKKKK